jgi:hypothetical protein
MLALYRLSTKETWLGSKGQPFQLQPIQRLDPPSATFRSATVNVRVLAARQRVLWRLMGNQRVTPGINVVNIAVRSHSRPSSASTSHPKSSQQRSQALGSIKLVYRVVGSRCNWLRHCLIEAAAFSLARARPMSCRERLWHCQTIPQLTKR